MKVLVAGVGCYFSHEERRGCVCIFLYSLTGVGVHAGVCVCMCAHIHTLHVGYSDVSPGVGTKHLVGPNNPDGLPLDMYVFVYVYKVHMCIHMLAGVMRPLAH